MADAFRCRPFFCLHRPSASSEFRGERDGGHDHEAAFISLQELSTVS